MKIGIDKIGFYTPHAYVDMHKLAIQRNEDPEKFTIGIGQDKMAVQPATQDAVTLAANAAWEMLDEADKEAIDLVIFGTESGVDHSKSAAVYVHRLLGLNPKARAIEVKQACYGATAGVQIAKGHIALNPDSKVLVLGSDIARYGLNTPGEVTQGAGATAIIISAGPKIMAFEENNAYLTADIMDFWRPIYSDTAFADGKYSNEQYIAFFNNVWKEYKAKSGLELHDYEAICFHLPYTKMGKKALRTILDEGTSDDQERLLANYQVSTSYNRDVGNIYTGSLYLSLLSLLEQKTDLPAGSRIGLYSYGSGAVGEFFSGILEPNYWDYLFVEQHTNLFAARKEVSISEYEAIFQEATPMDGNENVELNFEQDPAPICFTGITDNKRQYINKANESE